MIKNLNKLGEKQNRLFLILVFWLVIGITIIQIGNILIDLSIVFIGILVLLPSLAFLFFLYLFTFISKKDIREYALWKIFILFIVTLPGLVFLALVLAALFVISIISYIILTSWFILYGCYLIAKNLDERMYKRKYKAFTRSFSFFGGTLLALGILVGVTTGTFLLRTYVDIASDPILLVNSLIVGGIILIFFIIGLIYLIRGIFPAFLGIFSLLIVIYTFFLVFKVFLGLSGSGGSSTTTTQILLLVFDIFIIVYSVGTILGSQAELLSDKIKYASVDNVLIFLIFAKTAYEFAANFPYKALLGLQIPYIEYVVAVGSDLNLWKNIAVLAFFFILLLLVGFYEIHKYTSFEKVKKRNIQNKVSVLLTLVPTLGDKDVKNLKKARSITDFYERLRLGELIDQEKIEEMELHDGDLKDEVEGKRLKREFSEQKKLEITGDRMRMTTVMEQYKVIAPQEELEKKEITDEEKRDSEEESSDEEKDID